MRPLTRKALHLRREMRRAGVPEPSVWVREPNAFIFEWERGNKTLYITVTDAHISALISEPNGILHRETLQ